MCDHFHVTFFFDAFSEIFHENTLSKVKVQPSTPTLLKELFEVTTIKSVRSPSNGIYFLRPTDAGKGEACRKVLIPAKEDFCRW